MSNAGLTNYYRWHARIYDATRWAFLFGRAQLIRSTAANAGSPKRILEVGCGTGRNLVDLARMFPDAEIVGLDLSAEMLEKARRKVGRFGSRVTLVQGAYQAPIAKDDLFDLIVVSYCLSMIHPGYQEVVRLCQRDLSPQGSLAVVDFHDTSFRWFRSWMRLNHAHLDGQVLQALRASGMDMDCSVRLAYGGLWRWFTCFARTA